MWNIILEVTAPIVFACATIFFGLWRAKADESSEYYDMLTRWNSDHEADIEKLKKQYVTDLEHYKKLAREATDRANRNGAIAEGLAEDLAALKAYDPEEIEERLKKIREIRADEERRKTEEEYRKIEELLKLPLVQAMLQTSAMYNVNQFSPYTDIYRIPWR